MANEVKFSVGRISVGTDTLAKCTGITVRYDGNPVDLYAGGCVDPHAIEIGNRAITLTVEYAEWDTTKLNPDDILTNSLVNVELLASSCDAGRGIAGLTLADCKAVSWEMASTQDGFVTYRLELRKVKS
jgi:hypothetical protein